MSVAIPNTKLSNECGILECFQMGSRASAFVHTSWIKSHALWLRSGMVFVIWDAQKGAENEHSKFEPSLVEIQIFIAIQAIG